ncbi:hypothetical protein [Nocardia otitidiscaviarum]|uniref:hypothetical protein n=1 Tax=Nocardia otitidiscaviarum TaxID=1823 RepID=UPI0024555104|nr:hypothetical protein [Nocardia otitidiscaviarum]
MPSQRFGLIGLGVLGACAVGSQVAAGFTGTPTLSQVGFLVLAVLFGGSAVSFAGHLSGKEIAPATSQTKNVAL